MHPLDKLFLPQVLSGKQVSGSVVVDEAGTVLGNNLSFSESSQPDVAVIS
jgi:hypothetical protein